MCCDGIVKGHVCMGWLVTSIIGSVLLILLFVILESLLGGPFPTYYLATGSKLLYASNTITIITCILALLAIVKYSENICTYSMSIRLAVFVVANALLLFSNIVNAIAVATISYPIVEADVIDYSSKYRASTGEMPPAIVSFERLSKALSIDGVPMGCCGHTDFNDYNVNVTRCSDAAAPAVKELVKFKAPASCCKTTLTIDEIAHNYCENLAELDNNEYMSYDTQLFIQRLFNSVAKTAKEWKEVKNLAKKLGADFADWISGGPRTFTDDEMPPNDGVITYTPKLDCPRPLKRRFKDHLGDWDDKSTWGDAGGSTELNPDGTRPKNKNTAGDNYLDSVKSQVKTGVLGCGALLELLFGENNFVKIVLDHQGLGILLPILHGFRVGIITFIAIVLFLTISNMIWFNYYFVPLILFPGKWTNLFFYPKKNKVMPSTPGVSPTVSPTNQVLSTDSVKSRMDEEAPAEEAGGEEAGTEQKKLST